MALFRIDYEAPQHGWLPLRLWSPEKVIAIDASDVPNNPVQELINALDRVSDGMEAAVWFNLEPAGYFLHFKRDNDQVSLRLDYAADGKKHLAASVFALEGSALDVLMPFWRFLRKFESHGYQEPHWPGVDYTRLPFIKARLRL
jgi:hypothetical protein